MAHATCSIDGCNKPTKARGWCNPHYMRWWEMGSPTAQRAERKHASPARAFAARTQRRGECLIWTGAKIRSGYGTIWDGERVVPVHRWAWIAANGPIPDGAEVDHTCHNRLCANVDHLRLASRAQNMRNLSGAPITSRTGVRNVSRSKYGTFMVRITKDGITYQLGTYRTIEEAATVAARERLRLFGTFSGAA